MHARSTSDAPTRTSGNASAARSEQRAPSKAKHAANVVSVDGQAEAALGRVPLGGKREAALAPGSHKAKRRALRDPLLRPPALAALAVSIAVSGCFELVRSNRVGKICTPEAARTAGERDARRGSAPQESYASICGVSEEYLNGLYRRAYSGIPENERGTQSGVLDRVLP